MSVQAAQPLIWLARINTRFAVAGGSAASDPTAAAAALMCFTNFCRTSELLKSRRASMVISLASSSGTPGRHGRPRRCDMGAERYGPNRLPPSPGHTSRLPMMCAGC
jgi:hypothetical protein